MPPFIFFVAPVRNHVRACPVRSITSNRTYASEELLGGLFLTVLGLTSRYLKEIID